MTGPDLRKARERLGYTQAAFGDVLDVSRQTVINWEKGHTPIPKWIPLALKGLNKKPRAIT